MSDNASEQIKDLQAIISVARASVGVIGDGRMTDDALRTDLHAMRAILNTIERRIGRLRTRNYPATTRTRGPA
jgi:hypothetical protein